MNPFVGPIVGVGFAGVLFFGIIFLAKRSCNKHNGYRKGKGGGK